jgi:hemin uptake protein HemP
MSMADNTDPEEMGSSGPPDSGGSKGWIESRALFGDRDEVVIRHGDQVYRLKITRYGRLILNK